MTEGRIIEGRFPRKASSFDGLVEQLQNLPRDEKGNPIADSTKVARYVADAVRAASDSRTWCRDCAQPATREDGLCNRCRRHQQELG